MGIGIALKMPEARMVMGHQFAQHRKYIRNNVRVGVFVDGNCRSGMRAVNNYITICNTGLLNGKGDPAGNVYHLTAFFTADAENFINYIHLNTQKSQLYIRPLSHLFDHLDAQKPAQAVFDGVGGQMTKQ